MSLDQSRWIRLNGSEPMYQSRWIRAAGSAPLDQRRWIRPAGSYPLDQTRWTRSAGSDPLDQSLRTGPAGSDPLDQCRWIRAAGFWSFCDQAHSVRSRCILIFPSSVVLSNRSWQSSCSMIVFSEWVSLIVFCNQAHSMRFTIRSICVLILPSSVLVLYRSRQCSCSMVVFRNRIWVDLIVFCDQAQSVISTIRSSCILALSTSVLILKCSCQCSCPVIALKDRSCNWVHPVPRITLYCERAHPIVSEIEPRVAVVVREETLGAPVAQESEETQQILVTQPALVPPSPATIKTVTATIKRVPPNPAADGGERKWGGGRRAPCATRAVVMQLRRMARRAERREIGENLWEEGQAGNDRGPSSSNPHKARLTGWIKIRVRENRRVNQTNPRALNVTVPIIITIPCNNSGREQATTTRGSIGQQIVGRDGVRERRKEPKHES